MVKEAQEEVITETTKESALPVLRFLRPEFRAQLTLAKRKSGSPVCSPNRPLDTTDGAVERIIPIVVEGSNETSNSKVLEERETVITSVEKDGQYYLKLVLAETERLESLAAEMETEVSSVPEHMEGRLRAAAGKAKLLASQKLAQFKGLCHKNIVSEAKAKKPFLILNLETNVLKMNSQQPPMAGQADRLQGQDRSAVIHPSSSHA
ncbi:Disks large-associated protein [Homalodisca vitripennis]|nr:Disks large-associated protein [Homalodisca vitripennis]